MWSSSIVLLEWLASVNVTLTPSTSTVPPLFGSRIESCGHRLFHPDEPVGELDRRHDRAAELLRQVDRVPDVVVVAVRERDQVDPLGLLLVVRALGVRDPGIDVDPLAAGCVEAERGVTEPRELNVRHLSPFG